ncbi:MAG: hypothetical protein JWQ81_5414 [Amycolatopsis sp.]|jgi:hypothetical protein|uniref:hypothetical protein n=1 Tax=Amycolatopsis sp. TaxID=37632 RepID=UPI0026241F41|nr:hypothetical protein [Amycolatopsis sp.]MCU1684675.1 hypothetical protein [Amycolatopsis sp.]
MSSDSAQGPIWPANDPWWRFTPKNQGIGYFSLIGAGVVFASSLYILLQDSTNTKSTILEAAMGVIAVLWMVRAANGLKSLKRQQAIARRRSSS